MTGPRSPRVVVVGAGLAGIAAALECADQGARVTLLERRSRLGGLTWSFRHDGRWIDNGQHVFLRCCTEYLRFLARIGARDDIVLQDRLDVPVLAPAATPDGPPLVGRLHRSGLPAPLHLAAALLRYPHIGPGDRLRLGPAVAALRRVRLDDPATDRVTFGAWLARWHQSATAVEALWDLITVPTVNLAAAEASLTMAAKVFQTGLLEDRSAADIGWSRVPLGQLHGGHAAAALDRAGVDVRLGVTVRAVEPGRPERSAAGGFTVRPDGADRSGRPEAGRPALTADAVIVAVPHDGAGSVLPTGAVAHQDRLGDLGTSAVVDVHLLYDRPVLDVPFAAGLGSLVQWMFDRTASAGLGTGGEAGASAARRKSDPQYVAVSISAADRLLGVAPDELAERVAADVGRLLPAARGARVLSSLVTKERHATFRAGPGTAALRPPARTAYDGLAVAGAWTDTGWPATMEGAVRSGRAAARAALAGAATPDLDETEHQQEEVA